MSAAPESVDSTPMTNLIQWIDQTFIKGYFNESQPVIKDTDPTKHELLYIYYLVSSYRKCQGPNEYSIVLSNPRFFMHTKETFDKYTIASIEESKSKIIAKIKGLVIESNTKSKSKSTTIENPKKETSLIIVDMYNNTNINPETFALYTNEEFIKKFKIHPESKDAFHQSPTTAVELTAFLRDIGRSLSNNVADDNNDTFNSVDPDYLDAFLFYKEIPKTKSPTFYDFFKSITTTSFISKLTQDDKTKLEKVSTILSEKTVNRGGSKTATKEGNGQNSISTGVATNGIKQTTDLRVPAKKDASQKIQVPSKSDRSVKNQSKPLSDTNIESQIEIQSNVPTDQHTKWCYSLFLIKKWIDIWNLKQINTPKLKNDVSISKLNIKIMNYEYQYFSKKIGDSLRLLWANLDDNDIQKIRNIIEDHKILTKIEEKGLLKTQIEEAKQLFIQHMAVAPLKQNGPQTRKIATVKDIEDSFEPVLKYYSTHTINIDKIKPHIYEFIAYIMHPEFEFTDNDLKSSAIEARGKLSIAKSAAQKNPSSEFLDGIMNKIVESIDTTEEKDKVKTLLKELVEWLIHYSYNVRNPTIKKSAALHSDKSQKKASSKQNEKPSVSHVNSRNQAPSKQNEKPSVSHVNSRNQAWSNQNEKSSVSQESNHYKNDRVDNANKNNSVIMNEDEYSTREPNTNNVLYTKKTR